MEIMKPGGNLMLLGVIMLILVLLFLPGTALAEESGCSGDGHAGGSEPAADGGSTSGAGSSEPAADCGSTSGVGSSEPAGVGGSTSGAGSSEPSAVGGSTSGASSEAAPAESELSSCGSSVGETSTVESDAGAGFAGSDGADSEPGDSGCGNSDADVTDNTSSSQDNPDAGPNSVESIEGDPFEAAETAEPQGSESDEADEEDVRGADKADGSAVDGEATETNLTEEAGAEETAENEATNAEADDEAAAESPAESAEEHEAAEQKTYFIVTEESMNTMLSPGTIVELGCAAYQDGDTVIAQKSDGTYIVKMLQGDQLVPLNAGTSYTAGDVTILGTATLSGLTAEELEADGISYSSVQAETGVKPGGTGTSEDPYQIATWQNLYWLSQTSAAWENHFQQTGDIDFLEGEIKDWEGGKGWTPIGEVNNPNGPSAWQFFTGTFDGSGYTISNLFINRPDEDFVGLFGVLGPEGIVNNLSLAGVDITGGRSVGGLVGVNFGGTITNCSVNGGEVHSTHSGFEDADTGGLVGSNTGTIKNSYATGDVTSEGNRIGGLVGDNAGTIEDSYAKGSVAAEGDTLTHVGGLVGSNSSSGTITASYAKSNVTSTGVNSSNNTGGLAGSNQGEIFQSYASGNVTATATDDSSHAQATGGLVGNNDGTIVDSYASGDVAGANYVGGLVGWNWGTVNRCYSIGSVSGNNNVGGLVGSEGGAATVKYSFTASNVTGTVGSVGAIAGEIYHEGYIHNCGASGSVNNVAANQENLFGSIIEPTESGFGGGTAENNYPLSPSALKQLITYQNEGWSIAPLSAFDPNKPGAYTWYIDEGRAFPILWWQVDGVPARSGGRVFNTDPDFAGAFSTGTPPGGFPSSQAGTSSASAPGLTNISRSANSVITPAFVSTGSAHDLQQAKAAYQAALQSYSEQEQDLSPEQRAVLLTELAIAEAAILALEVNLLDQAGETYDLPALVDAYSRAFATLDTNRGQLSAREIAAAEALLAEIKAVIDARSG